MMDINNGINCTAACGVTRSIFGAGGGGRTHMLSEERGILSPVRLPIPPLQRRCISEYSRLPIPHLPECLRCTVSEN